MAALRRQSLSDEGRSQRELYVGLDRIRLVRLAVHRTHRSYIRTADTITFEQVEKVANRHITSAITDQYNRFAWDEVEEKPGGPTRAHICSPTIGTDQHKWRSLKLNYCVADAAVQVNDPVTRIRTWAAAPGPQALSISRFLNERLVYVWFASPSVLTVRRYKSSKISVLL